MLKDHTAPCQFLSILLSKAQNPFSIHQPVSNWLILDYISTDEVRGSCDATSHITFCWWSELAYLPWLAWLLACPFPALWIPRSLPPLSAYQSQIYWVMALDWHTSLFVPPANSNVIRITQFRCDFNVYLVEMFPQWASCSALHFSFHRLFTVHLATE